MIKADIRADIRDGEKMKEIFAEYQPEIVFHLAAQPSGEFLVYGFEYRRIEYLLNTLH